MKFWSENIKFAPDADGKNWIIYDPINNRKTKVPTEILANYVIGVGEKSGLLDDDLKALSLVDVEHEMDASIERWISEGWDQSLYYFCASRSVNYVDEDINRESRIDSIEKEVGGYMKEGTYPLPKRKTVDIFFKQVQSKGKSLGWVLKNRSCTDPMEAITDFSLDDLGGLLEDSLGFLRKNYLVESVDRFDRLKTMDTFGRPFRYYIINYGIKGLEQGVYQYDLLDHGLTTMKNGDYRDYLVDCLIGHKTSKNSAFSIVIVADLKIWQWFYRHERALRNLYIDAGAIMQAILLHATTFELRTHITPASHDSLFNPLLDLEEVEEQVFYTLTAG